MPAFDLVVIGGGAGGLVAAREAVRRGARTALVSDGPLGGDCTHTGCVPSKTLLAAAASGASFSEAMAAVRDRVETIAATEDEAALRSEGIEVFAGRARLAGAGVVDIDGHRIGATGIVVATGSRASVPPIPGLVDVPYLTNETLFALDRLPARLAVLGGGPIGLEMSQAFQQLGAAVSVIEAEDRLLPREEPEASAIITDRLSARGVEVRTGSTVERAAREPDGATVLRFGDGTTCTVDAVLVAAGRTPVTDGLDVADAGVALDEGGNIRTDDALATTAPGIWAVGDVTGRMPFTHAAGGMAFVAVANALAGRGRLRPARFDPSPIPWVTFTDPEIARVGMTEAEAATIGGRVAFLPFADLDRAVITGRTDGFVKLIAGPRRLLGMAGGGRILGATIVAPTGGEMIGEIALAMRTGMFAGRLAQTTHAYPTWSIAIQQTAAQFFMTYQGRTARPARPESRGADHDGP